MDYAPGDGSAQAGVDYTAASGTLTFQASESSTTIEVAVLVSYDPTPDTPLGLTARVSPAWGGDAMSGAEALCLGGHPKAAISGHLKSGHFG